MLSSIWKVTPLERGGGAGGISVHKHDVYLYFQALLLNLLKKNDGVVASIVFQLNK